MDVPRPVLVFDGDCGICTTLSRIVVRWLRPPAAVRPWQQLPLEEYGLTPQRCAEALQYVDADGRVHAAEMAVARLLRVSRPWFRPLGVVIALPGVRQVAGLVYRWVARNRSRLPGGTPACAVPPPSSPPPPAG